ncbi:tripartite tricarboxylate transporter TctB family protein [Cryobacterium sp. Y57]|uniref:tripartite tricarboxylate transporter TctB family protein n=1 Tax=Cryobacterium sp. Y57 TaxID=2048287 RepID=UPI000CE36889|nr:tripartite tricarboxylate transporter TctB family protein [Cryobacterium sp. Y57]
MTDVVRTEHDTGTITEHNTSDPVQPLEGIRGRGIARWAAVAVLAAVGVGAIVLSIGYGLGTGTRPGPGLWPFVAAVLMLGATAVVAITDTLEDYEPWGTESVRTLIAIASLVFFAVLFTLLGFTVSAILLMLLWLRMFGQMRWLQGGLLAVGGGIALFMLFDVVLGVPMPRDLLMTPLTSRM